MRAAGRKTRRYSPKGPLRTLRAADRYQAGHDPLRSIACGRYAESEKIGTRTLSGSNSFLGQKRPGVLKLGSISIGMTTDGQQLGVITFRLLAVPGQLCRMGGT
jgi:hypothetical protein